VLAVQLQEGTTMPSEQAIRTERRDAKTQTVPQVIRSLKTLNPHRRGPAARPGPPATAAASAARGVVRIRPPRPAPGASRTCRRRCPPPQHLRAAPLPRRLETKCTVEIVDLVEADLGSGAAQGGHGSVDLRQLKRQDRLRLPGSHRSTTCPVSHTQACRSAADTRQVPPE